MRTFPSGAFLFDDEATGRRVLFDTGYAPGAWETGWRGAAYRRVLPPSVDDADDIGRQLPAAGIDPASVTHVVLSHLHPDHVGGVRWFPEATFVMSGSLLGTLQSARIRDGILPGLLPEWFSRARMLLLTDDSFESATRAGIELRAADVFDDGSYLIVDLPGHAAGHIGALVDGRVLLAGDAAWGNDLIDVADELRMLPRAIQHDYAAYRRTSTTLRTLVDAGVRVVCSHDSVSAQELLA